MNTSSNKSTAREIDFLPESYREQSTQRKGQLWRFAVLALFTVVLPAASFCQYRMRTAINSDLTSLSPHYAAAQADTTRVAFLQGELKKAAAAAELYTFLRHPWPRTQVLSALTETLPESITLRAISIDSLQAETSRESRRERHQTKDEEAKLALLPAADRDLAKLRKQAEKNYVVIQLDGETLDAGDLHRYIGKLGAHPLFRRAEVESIEAPNNDQDAFARFRAKIVIRPGYGLAGGPSQPPKSTETPADRPDEQDSPSTNQTVFTTQNK